MHHAFSQCLSFTQVSVAVSEGFENPVSRHQIFQGKVEVIEIIIIIVITTTVLG
jgi:hypothetical protein